MKEDEVDLIELYKRLSESPSFQKIKNRISFALSNKLWFILFALIGIGLGIYFKSLQTPIYKSQMLVRSNFLDNHACKHIINSLKQSIEEENTTELEKAGFATLAQHIKKIDFAYPDDRNDSLKKREPFKVIVYTHGNGHFQDIEQAVYGFLKNNKYSLEDEKSRQVFLERKREELTKKNSLLDSVQNKLIAQVDIDTKETTSITAIINEKTNTKIELAELERKIKNNNNFEIVQSMPPSIKPDEKYDSSKLIYLSVFVSLIIGGSLLRYFKK